MVSQIDHFDVIVADSEFEALILENSLIKRHQPHYNILLKDDKGLPLYPPDGEGALPPAFPGQPGGGGRGAVLRPLRRPGGHPEYHRRPAHRPEAASCRRKFPGHRKGAALPQLPHGPV